MQQKGKVIPLRTGGYRADAARERNLLGERIGAARRGLGLTQGALAERLAQYGVRVQAPAVNKWEKGETVPNAYQLIALCHALRLRPDLSDFTGPVAPPAEVLNAEGQRMLRGYRDYLESQDRYTVRRRAATVEMRVSLLPASAGLGDFLDAEQFETQTFPAAAVPAGADLAVPVDGDSMEPLYRDGQLIWIELCPTLNDGDVGLFVVDGHGYVKTYRERQPAPDALDAYLDSSGVLHPQVVLLSQNPKYPPRIITPEMDFRIVGRVLN